MVCGGDVLNSFSVPGLWDPADVSLIASRVRRVLKWMICLFFAIDTKNIYYSWSSGDNEEWLWYR